MDDVDHVIGCAPVTLTDFHVQELRSCIGGISAETPREKLVVCLVLCCFLEQNQCLFHVTQSLQAAQERFEQVLGVYSSSLVLLPAIPDLVALLVDLCSPDRGEDGHFDVPTETALRFLHSLSKFANFRQVARFLPNEIQRLAPMLDACEFYSRG